MQKIFTLLISLIMCAASTSSAAATADSAGAAHLKQMIEGEISRYTEIRKLGGQGILVEGPVDVVPHGTYYKATLSKVSFFPGPDKLLNIGTIALNAAPGPGGTWEIKASLPASMRLYDKNNKSLADVTVESQKITATWLPAESIYPIADSLFQKIKVSALGDEAFAFSIGKLHVTSRLHDNGDGTWTGPGGFEATDIQMDAAGKKPTVIEVGKVTATNQYTRINLGKLMGSRKQLLEMARLGKIPETPEGRKLLPDLQKSIDGMDGSFEISNILVREKGAEKPVEIRIDKASFQGGLQGMQREKSTSRLKSSFSGLKMSFVPAEFSSLTPHAMNLEMDIKNLPINGIIEKISALPQGTTPLNIPEMLQQSGASLLVRDSFVQSKDMDIGISGNLDSNAQSVTGMSGQMTFSIKGLESAISLLQTMATRPGADLKTVGYASALTGVMLMGRSAQDAKGEKVNNYILEMTPDGKLLINGMNIMTLVKAGEVLNQHVNPDNPLIKKISPK